MQTFVPYENVDQCAQSLDRQRLGKQRVEVLQILKSLRDGGGWSNHPAVRMWRGYENALVEYGLAVCNEWMARGYKDTCYGKIAGYIDTERGFATPQWWGGPIHKTHRAALLAKNPGWYSRFDWIEEPGIDYYWPV